MESHQSRGQAARTSTGQPPIDKDQFQSLVAYVDEMLAVQGCDNTLAHAEAWARAHDVGWARLGRDLRGMGGFCDCEIGMNLRGDEEVAGYHEDGG